MRLGTWAFVLALACPGVAHAQEPASVLVVDAAEPGQPERIAFQEAFEEALQTPSAVAIHTFNLDLWRPGDADSPRTLDARVRERYQGVKMAVIVALTDPAIDAALRWRDALWPGVPVICLQTSENDSPCSSAHQASSIRVHVDPTATLRARS